MKYKYIVIEWIHGAWKSAVSDALIQKFVQRWINAKYYHFPNESEHLGKAIREALTIEDVYKKREVIWLLYAAMTNKFHITTQNDWTVYILDREAVTSWLIFQKEIPDAVRAEIYKYGIKSLQKQWIVLYVKIDRDTALDRLQLRNADLWAKGEVRDHKAKDKFVVDNFERLTAEYEKDFIPKVKALWLQCEVIDNSGTLEHTIQQIEEIIGA